MVAYASVPSGHHLHQSATSELHTDDNCEEAAGANERSRKLETLCCRAPKKSVAFPDGYPGREVL